MCGEESREGVDEQGERTRQTDEALQDRQTTERRSLPMTPICIRSVTDLYCTADPAVLCK